MIKYAFAAIVVAPLGDKYIVIPQIKENDGTMHPEIEVLTRDGITPLPGDTVLVEVMMNDKDLSVQRRFFEPSESNGIIIGILKSLAGQYVLTGSYIIVGSLTIEGAMTVVGALTATSITSPTISAGALIIAGVPLPPSHTHGPGSYNIPGTGAVVGTSGPA